MNVRITGNNEPIENGRKQAWTAHGHLTNKLFKSEILI